MKNKFSISCCAGCNCRKMNKRKKRRKESKNSRNTKRNWVGHDGRRSAVRCAGLPSGTAEGGTLRESTPILIYKSRFERTTKTCSAALFFVQIKTKKKKGNRIRTNSRIPWLNYEYTSRLKIVWSTISRDRGGILSWCYFVVIIVWLSWVKHTKQIYWGCENVLFIFENWKITDGKGHICCSRLLAQSCIAVLVSLSSRQLQQCSGFGIIGSLLP